MSMNIKIVPFDFRCDFMCTNSKVHCCDDGKTSSIDYQYTENISYSQANTSWLRSLTQFS